MYSEFFDQLGANRRLQRESTTNSDEPAPLVSVKAGKMALTKQAQEPVSFQCESIRTRGEIRLLWKDNALKWQWYDRRDRQVRDEFVISPDSSSSTFERVPMTSKKHENDRIYVWTRPEAEEEQERYLMYWMQDASEEKDDEIAAPESDRMETDESTTANAASANQVDALSNILENLGMPQSSSSEMSTEEAGAASSTPRATLTLADLQGAMAGIQEQSSTSRTAPVLSDVVTPEAITGILQDEAARNRLLELLPPEQRSEEHLEDNLRSPAVQQTLRHLTATLLPDDDWSGFYTVLANFQLDPADGHDAIAAGNPVQAFLDCVLASVKKEAAAEGEEQNNGNEEKEEEEKQGE